MGKTEWPDRPRKRKMSGEEYLKTVHDFLASLRKIPRDQYRVLIEAISRALPPDDRESTLREFKDALMDLAEVQEWLIKVVKRALKDNHNKEEGEGTTGSA